MCVCGGGGGGQLKDIPVFVCVTPVLNLVTIFALCSLNS